MGIAEIPNLKAIVVWTATEEQADIERPNQDPVKVYTWKSFLALGTKVPDDDVQKRIDAQEPGHCVALIYTSGTTGKPKAVMISHDNLIFQGCSVLKEIGLFGVDPNEEERIISYLPLSHIAAVLVDFMVAMIVCGKFKGHVCVYFARPYDLKAGSLGDRLRSIQPTFFLGVPRVWEKVSDKIRQAGRATKGPKKKLLCGQKVKV